VGPVLVRLLILLVIGIPAGYAAITLFHDSDNERVVSAPAENAIVIPQSDRRVAATVIRPVGIDEPEPRQVRTTTVNTGANTQETSPKPSAPKAVDAPKVPEAASNEGDHHEFDAPDGVTRKEGLLGAVAEVSALVPNADPVYLMALADKESNFAPSALAKASTAAGLYQFTEATWLETIKRVGARYGLEHDAEQIRMVSGRPVVSDPAVLKEILDRRHNPTIAAIMAAEKANYDKEKIEQQVGRKLNRTESYIAHLLGTGAATQFLKLRADAPDSNAADAFPKAAPGNASLFYRKTASGREALSIQQMYDLIDRMIEKRLKEYAEFHDPSVLSHAYTEFDIE